MLKNEILLQLVQGGDSFKSTLTRLSSYLEISNFTMDFLFNLYFVFCETGGYKS